MQLKHNNKLVTVGRFDSEEVRAYARPIYMYVNLECV